MNLARKIELLDEQMAEAKGGHPENLDGWRKKTRVVLRNVMGEDSPLLREFGEVEYEPGFWFDGMDTSGYGPEGVREALTVLEAAKVELVLQNELEPSREPEEARSVESIDSTPASIFIVHGHEDARKHELARFLKSATGLDPVILHEQTNGGLTIIEKLEKHASTAGFAVVLLTADDLGHAKGVTTSNPRARQNVVFEAGYFVGRLGREKVTLLLEEGVERPGDLDGVVYTSLDAAGGWKAALLKDAEGAGLVVDWSALGR